MNDRADPYEETLHEQASYFGLDPEGLRETFAVFLGLPFQEAKDKMDPFDRAVCVGIYRVVKLKWAFRIAGRSRDLWVQRAKDAGWAPTEGMERRKKGRDG